MEPWQLAFRDRQTAGGTLAGLTTAPRRQDVEPIWKDARRQNTGIPERVPFCEERDGWGFSPTGSTAVQWDMLPWSCALRVQHRSLQPHVAIEHLKCGQCD